MENLSNRFVLRTKFLITSFRNGIMGEFKLSGFSSDGRETGGAMLSVNCRLVELITVLCYRVVH